jgi:hypothetical protein
VNPEDIKVENMKKLIAIISLLSSVAAFAGSFDAVIIEELNVLSISISDDAALPPYEAGKLWDVMRGVDQRKYIEASGFSMECDGIKAGSRDTFGACTLQISMKQFTKVGDTQVFKLSGSAAAKLNRFFTDSAYVSLQGGDVFLSSYNTRREFTFGIKDNLIQRYFGQQ